MPIAGGTNYEKFAGGTLYLYIAHYYYGTIYLYIYSLLLWYHLFMYSPLLWYHLFLYKPLLFRYLGCRSKKTKSRTFFPMYFYYGVPILHQSIPCPPHQSPFLVINFHPAINFSKMSPKDAPLPCLQAKYFFIPFIIIILS